ncbi:hypothetical protein [Gibbsiella dentisursi]|uniref:hypothetical protein n=1 Tax=Gibbsiella dentisursi TaxID=796890 RepID=UPI0031F7DD16
MGLARRRANVMIERVNVSKYVNPRNPPQSLSPLRRLPVAPFPDLFFVSLVRPFARWRMILHLQPRYIMNIFSQADENDY